MPNNINEPQICAYFMRHGTIEGESGVTTTQAGSNAASDTFRDKQIKEQPLHAGEQLRAPPTRVGKEAAAMKDKNDAPFESVPELRKALGLALNAKQKPELSVDTAKYQAYLDDPDLSDEQKEQIVEAIWKIILCFVDLGFGVSPVEQACGQVVKSEDDSGKADSDLLECKASSLTQTFNNEAAE